MCRHSRHCQLYYMMCSCGADQAYADVAARVVSLRCALQCTQLLSSPLLAPDYEDVGITAAAGHLADGDAAAAEAQHEGITAALGPLQHVALFKRARLQQGRENRQACGLQCIRPWSTASMRRPCTMQACSSQRRHCSTHCCENAGHPLLQRRPCYLMLLLTAPMYGAGGALRLSLCACCIHPATEVWHACASSLATYMVPCRRPCGALLALLLLQLPGLLLCQGLGQQGGSRGGVRELLLWVGHYAADLCGASAMMHASPLHRYDLPYSMARMEHGQAGSRQLTDARGVWSTWLVHHGGRPPLPGNSMLQRGHARMRYSSMVT